MNFGKLGVVVVSMVIFTFQARANEPIENDDIVITSYEPVIMERGKGNVFPIFRIKNTGSRKYKEVHLYYETPKGLAPNGKEVSLERTASCKYDWQTVTLLPGQEIPFNPSRDTCVHLRSKTDQPEITYSTRYRFEFYDEEGHSFQTPLKEISEFVTVTSFNNDIVVSSYNPVIMEQGKGNVFPIFRIKNTGSRKYKEVHLYYEMPKGLAPNGKEVSLERTASCKYDWQTVTLLPGQEIPFNPSRDTCVHLRSKTDQPEITYSTRYRFEFYDEYDHSFQTPLKEISEFVTVTSFNNDIVVSSYNPVIMEQGKGNVFPIFRIKNTGSRKYKEVHLYYEMPKGLAPNGKEVSLERTASCKYDWQTVTLLPGQEIPFNPSRDNCVHLRSKTDQPEITYSTRYRFEFYDEYDHSFQTPLQTINEFAELIPFNNDIVVVKYSPVILQPGDKEVFPVFQIQNTGDREYNEVRLYYETPKGLAANGREVSLERTTSCKHDWQSTTLLPGQSVSFNPSRDTCVQLRARKDQAGAVYGTRYNFEFFDKEEHVYRTPKAAITEFAAVPKAGETPSLETFSASGDGTRNGPLSGANFSNITKLKDRLDAELKRLENVVHPSQLEELKKIQQMLNSVPHGFGANVGDQSNAKYLLSNGTSSLVAAISDGIAGRRQAPLFPANTKMEING